MPRTPKQDDSKQKQKKNDVFLFIGFMLCVLCSYGLYSKIIYSFFFFILIIFSIHFSPPAEV